MKIFLSWSGDKSRVVAERFRQWLPDVIQSLEPWMSGIDIGAGVRWTPELSKQLSETSFGIICLTRENQSNPWILFEAGALAKTIDESFVVPYLIDMEPTDLKGPLAQFQAKRWDKKETLELVLSINESLGKERLEEERVRRMFGRAWPELEKAFEKLDLSDSSVEIQRSTDDILREVLELVRDLSRGRGTIGSGDTDNVKLKVGIEEDEDVTNFLNALASSDVRLRLMSYRVEGEPGNILGDVVYVYLVFARYQMLKQEMLDVIRSAAERTGVDIHSSDVQ